MSHSRSYDTVAFDVRDNATMLFFARTSDEGDIQDYLLLMRAVEDEFIPRSVEIRSDDFSGRIQSV